MYSGPELPPEQVVTLRRTSASNVHLIEGEGPGLGVGAATRSSRVVCLRNGPVVNRGRHDHRLDAVRRAIRCRARCDLQGLPSEPGMEGGGGNPGVDKLFADLVNIETGKTASCQALNQPISYY